MSMKHSLTLAVAVMAVLAVAGTAGAAVIDAVVQSRIDDVGGSTSVSGGSLAVGDGSAGGGATPAEYRTILEFDIASNAAEINAATTIELSIQIKGLAGSPLDFDLVAVDDADGAATTGDFSSAASVVQFFAANTLSDEQVITVDVTSFVKADLLAGQSYSAFRFQANDAELLEDGTGQYFQFYKTSDASATVQGPMLTTVVPEPGSMALAGLGALATLIRRRSKRS